MTRLLWMSAIVLLLLMWLLYRENRHRKNTRVWQKKYHQKNCLSASKGIDELRIKEKNKPAKNDSLENDSLESDIRINGLINSLNTVTPKLLTQLKILLPGMIDEETFAIAIKIVDSIKRPHPALQALTSNISPEELIDIMHGCPDITAKILTTVNSSAFALSQPITSINHAVIYLGINIVKSITIQFLMKESICMETDLQKQAFKKLWLASYITSSLSFLLAQSLSKINAAELSTKALLNNIGCFAILSYDNDFSDVYLNESSLIKRTIAEQKKHSLNSTIIGYHIAKKWKLPRTMLDSIGHNYFTLQYNSENQTITIAKKQELVFCYFMCRLGDEVAYNNLRNIEDFDLNEITNLDYFYLQEALEDLELKNCLNMMQNKTFIKKANRIIKQAIKSP